jgi:hypothetical protein
VQWPPELQTVMDKALANHPADRYQHVSQFGRELVTAVATMPESAFTSTGTVELSPVAAAAKTEVRPLGGGAAGRRDRSNEELPVPELEEEKTGSPVALIFGVLVLLILGGGGGWWYWNSHQVTPSMASATAPATTTAPPVAPAADSARPDSTSSAVPHDSTPPAVTPAGDTAAPKAAAAEPPKSTIAPDQLDDMLAPIREDLSVGKQRMSEGQYDGAVVRFGSAQDKIAPLARKYADVPQIRALRREINEALSQNHAACKAEHDLALEHGSTSPPECP